MFKSVLSVAATVLTVAIFLPYVLSIQRGETRPHVVSWIVWALGTLAVFAAQVTAGGGVGAWPVGLSGAICAYIAVLSYAKRGDFSVTRADWACVAASLVGLAVWLATSHPLWAVFILTAVDLIGFIPTFRKAYIKPHEERIWFFVLGAGRNLLVVLALEAYSLTTVLFPAAIGLASLGLVALLAVRRMATITKATSSKLAE